MSSGTWVDLGGRLCVVTGANTGIGKEIARLLARAKATVVMASRDEAKGNAARDEIVRDTKNDRVSVARLDLADIDGTKRFAEDFLGKHGSLDVLVNNAAAWWPDRATGYGGHERAFVVNVLGPHALTHTLLPGLRKTGRGRVVNVASTAAGGLDLDDIDFARRKYSGMTAYSQTKQANRMLTRVDAKKLSGTGCTVNACSPGFVKTELNRNVNGFFAVFLKLAAPFQRTPVQGADTPAWLAASPDVEGVSGKFFVDRKDTTEKFDDDAEAARLHASCCEWTGVTD